MRLLPSKSKQSAGKNAEAPSALQSEHARLRREIALYSVESSKYIRLLNDARNTYEQEKANLQEALKKELDRVQSARTEAESDLANARRQADELEQSNDAKHYHDLCAKLEQERDVLSRLKSNLEERLSEAERKQESIVSVMRELEEREEALESDRSRLQASYEQKKHDLSTRGNALSLKEAEISNALNALDARSLTVANRESAVTAREEVQRIERLAISKDKQVVLEERKAIKDAYEELERAKQHLKKKYGPS